MKLSNAKNVAAIISWMHETLVNEVQIIDHTALDKSRFLDVLNSIFSKEMCKKIKQKLEKEISSQEDFSHSFELYYMIISFYQIMKDQILVKLQISKKDDLTDLTILSFFTELK